MRYKQTPSLAMKEIVAEQRQKLFCWERCNQLMPSGNFCCRFKQCYCYESSVKVGVNGLTRKADYLSKNKLLTNEADTFLRCVSKPTKH